MLGWSLSCRCTDLSGSAEVVRAAACVAAPDGQRAPADDAVAFARERAVGRQRAAVHGSHAAAHHRVREVGRARDLRQEQHVGVVPWAAWPTTSAMWARLPSTSPGARRAGRRRRGGSLRAWRRLHARLSRRAIPRGGNAGPKGYFASADAAPAAGWMARMATIAAGSTQTLPPARSGGNLLDGRPRTARGCAARAPGRSRTPAGRSAPSPTGPRPSATGSTPTTTRRSSSATTRTAGGSTSWRSIRPGTA